MQLGMDPLSLLMFARDNKYQELEAAITLGFSPDTGDQVSSWIYMSYKLFDVWLISFEL
jgi:hypothetical protein